MAEIKVGEVRRVTKEDNQFFGRNGKIVEVRGVGGSREFRLTFNPWPLSDWFYAFELTYVPDNEIPVMPADLQLAPAQPATADAGAGCRCGYPMSDHDADGSCPGDGYVGQGERIESERLANYRAIFTDVIEGHLSSSAPVMAERGLKLLNHVADLQAKLAAAEALAATNASLLANAQSELDTVREWVKVCESNWHDNGAALAAILDERGMTELTIGGRYIYKTMDGSAASFAVDAQGNRVQSANG